jgi:hypothetical protein
MSDPKQTAFVAVFEAPDDVEAQMIRARLEVAGFHPVIRNEFSAMTLLGGQSSSMARLIVEVPAREAADAKSLLESPPDTAE